VPAKLPDDAPRVPEWGPAAVDVDAVIPHLMGLALNVFTVWFLARLGLYFLAANLLGIAIGFIVSYAFRCPGRGIGRCGKWSTRKSRHRPFGISET
jgi:hypothetical protein